MVTVALMRKDRGTMTVRESLSAAEPIKGPVSIRKTTEVAMMWE